MKLNLKIIKKYPTVFGISIAVLVAATIISTRAMGMFQFLELAMYDYYMQFQPQITLPDDRILLVTISETDIQNQGTWPIPDGTMAQMLEIILAQHPKVIGLDMYRDIPVAPGSKQLQAVFSDVHNIVAVKKLGDERTPGINQPYMVKDFSLIGSNDILVDPEGVVRRGLLFLDDGKESYPSFALLIALLYLRDKHITLEPVPSNPEILKFGKTVFIPLETNDGSYIGMDARGYQFFLDFSGAGSAISTLSLTEVLSFPSFSDADKRRFSEKIQNKIVLIGSTAESLKDFFFIPFNRPHVNSKTIPGVEIHASIVSQLLNAAVNGKQPMNFIRESFEWAWIIAWSLIGCFLGLCICSFWRFLIFNIFSIAGLAGSTFMLFAKGFWIPVIPPAMAILMSEILITMYLSYQEKAEREILMRLFSSHVSKDVAEAIWEQREQFIESGRPRPQKLIATVLFTDMKGFTSVAEKTDVQILMDWLNEYMEAMVKAVRNNNGVVNKFIGDAVMAVFGVPIVRTREEQMDQDAVNAVNCALDMKDELEKLNAVWREQNRPLVKMRVGICTGPLVVGSIGSIHRQEYTVIGDTVNIGSRLESFDKNFDAENICRILISEATLLRLKNRFETRKLTHVSLKGKLHEVVVYQVMGKKEESESV